MRALGLLLPLNNDATTYERIFLRERRIVVTGCCARMPRRRSDRAGLEQIAANAPAPVQDFDELVIAHARALP